MASDTNDTVVIAIQGNPVSDAVLDVSQDGYVLTWINADDQWEAKPATPQVSLQSQTFTSSGTWTCPANVYTVILDGCGGGGGGGGGGGFGAGPNGGDGNGSGAGNPGNNAPANSGAGGSGAGCGTSGNYDGGNGGSGQLIVAWIGIA